jgi:hypothetical protein
MAAPLEIQKNAQWVIDNFGPQSGLPRFGYDVPSVAYLDTFIDRQGMSFRSSEKSIERIVNLLGAFVGEAIIATYGGEWQQSEKGVSVAVQGGGQVHCIQPFDKVHKRLVNGKEDNLRAYFAEFLPRVLSQPPPAVDSQPSSPSGVSPKKPWWKIF